MPQFAKLSQVFAHRKQGAQRKFEREYLVWKDKVQTAWLAELVQKEMQFKEIAKGNVALATTKLERDKQAAMKIAKSVMNNIFREWRVEIDRIISELGGYPQEDGMILFPDGSTARKPKGLWIAPDQQLRFNI